MVNINIQKKDLWLLSAIVVFLVGVGYVIAIDSGDYTVHGHDAGEIEGRTTYVSAWERIDAQQSVTFDHPLGTDELIIDIQFKPSLAGNIYRYHGSDYAGWGQGMEVYSITSTQIKVSAGNHIRVYSSSGRSLDFDSGGYVRVLAIS